MFDKFKKLKFGLKIEDRSQAPLYDLLILTYDKWVMISDCQNFPRLNFGHLLKERLWHMF